MNKIEHEIQSDCVKWFRAKYKNGIIFSVPNAQQRNYATLNYQKAEGLLTGAPDTVIVLPNGVTFFAEFKKPGGKQSSEQISIQEKFDKISEDLYWIVTSKSDFITIVEYLTGEYVPKIANKSI